MTPHLSEEQLLALLHGELTGDARDHAKAHLADCSTCAEALARDARLDEVLRVAGREPLPRAAAPARPVRRPRRARWIAPAAAAAGLALVFGHAGHAGLSSSAQLSAVGVLAWQNVIFYIPLLVGLLLVAGSAFGGHGHDAGHDADHGADHDADHDHDGFSAKALSLLGVGRVPLTVVLMIASLVFGGTGIILNTLLASAGLQPWLYGAVSLGGAFVTMVLLTGSTARLLDRFLPSTETYLVTRQGFAGCTGTLLLPADATSGYAQVKDPEGNVHNVKCRTIKGALPKGAEILIIEYDERTSTYVIDANPVLDRQA